ncbi:MAG TPA: zinc-ribbon and DUF3426 domain-containing protein [Usitatibacter sp.]|jgi:predicted Zn finger-like uncharacterized protein|nr:zinc-ribbon and DUF3426 domain-containing protein [Usitatibacter sp.]
MLITTCTHCLARFRVSPQQLNAKQGQVRCGRCNKVFSGFEALERFPDDDTGARLLAAREASERGSGRTGADNSPEALPEVQPVDAPEPTPAPLPVPPASSPSPPARAAAPMVEPPAPMPSTPHRPARAPSRPVVEYEETDPMPRRRPSRAWAFGVFLLLLVLAGEGAYALRGTIAERYPPARPWLVKACVPLHCGVPWHQDEEHLRTEDSDLYEVPGTSGELLLTARVRNAAAVPQAYPYLELTLTDRTGQAAARRVLKPADYLGRTPAADEAIAPGGELAIQLRLATPRIKPTGYHVEFLYSPGFRPQA